MNDLWAKLTLPPEVERALAQGAALVISVSGGKDSDAMCQLLPEVHRARGWTGPIALVHADLKDSEWSMTSEYVQHRAAELSLPLFIVSRKRGSLWEQMQQRHQQRPEVPPFPSAAARYCTADHKRTPIDGFLRRFQPTGTAVCAIGIRAQESHARAKKPTYRLRESVTTQSRTVYDWHPLFDFTIEDIWAALEVDLKHLNEVREQVQRRRSGEEAWPQAISEVGWRWHPAYALGNERLSCSLCVLAGKNDLLNGIHFHPDYYRKLVDLELQSGFSFRQGLWLADLRPDLLTDEQVERFKHLRGSAAPHPRPGRTALSAPVQLAFDL